MLSSFCCEHPALSAAAEGQQKVLLLAPPALAAPPHSCCSRYASRVAYFRINKMWSRVRLILSLWPIAHLHCITQLLPERKHVRLSTGDCCSSCHWRVLRTYGESPVRETYFCICLLDAANVRGSSSCCCWWGWWWAGAAENIFYLNLQEASGHILLSRQEIELLLQCPMAALKGRMSLKSRLHCEEHRNSCHHIHWAKPPAATAVQG